MQTATYRDRALKASSSRRSSARRVILLLVCLLVASTLTGLATSGCGSSWADQARKAEVAGDFAAATKLYEQRIKEDPKDLVAIKGLAAVYYVAGRFNDALPYEQEAVARDPKDAQTRIELGFNYLNHQRQASKAVDVMTEAARLEPSAKYLTFLAQAQMGANDLQAAEQSLRKAIATEGTYVHSYEVLITLLQNEGRTADAAQVSQTAAGAGVKIQPAAGA